jgi:hypothetical protein
MLSITAPADMTVTADQLCPQGDCAQVNYTFTVSGGVPPYHLVCTPLDSGSRFPVGSYNVRCFAQDSAGDSTPEASFTLTVTAPGGSGGGSGAGGGSGGSGGGTGSSGSGSGTGSGGSGSSGGASGETTPNQANTSEGFSLGGAPRVGHVLIARVRSGKPLQYVWELKRAGTWRRLAHQTGARLLVKATYIGCRLRVRVKFSNSRILYSSTTAPVHH